MSILQEKIIYFLKEYNLVNPEKTYLIGFSGGPDSMCLLHVLRRITPNRIVAIHLNHNWRGLESDIEEQNCKEFCNKFNIEFYSEKLNSDVAKNETSARKKRYEFFEKCAKKFDSDIIFTAHNKNDNIETLIFRICHGTGISGLRGVSPKRNIYYRPLLDISRDEIEKYCQNNKLNVNIDSSNFDTVHKRNYIRKEILPMLSKVDENAQDSIQSLCEIAKEETAILQEYINITLKKISDDKGKLKTKDFLMLSESLQKRILYELLSPKIEQNYDRQRILNIWNFIKDSSDSKSGKKISLTKDIWVFVSSKNIELITRKEKKYVCTKITEVGKYNYGRFIIDISECDRIPDEGYGNGSGTVFLDLSGVNLKELVFRNRQEGDIIQPFGMEGSQKLKKYLNSKKIPNHEKDELLFLADGKEILWAAGLGLSEKVRVKSIPTHRITIIEDK